MTALRKQQCCHFPMSTTFFSAKRHDKPPITSFWSAPALVLSTALDELCRASCSGPPPAAAPTLALVPPAGKFLGEMRRVWGGRVCLSAFFQGRSETERTLFVVTHVSKSRVDRDVKPVLVQ